jgi:hypothetical protein
MRLPLKVRQDAGPVRAGRACKASPIIAVCALFVNWREGFPQEGRTIRSRVQVDDGPGWDIGGWVLDIGLRSQLSHCITHCITVCYDGSAFFEKQSSMG